MEVDGDEDTFWKWSEDAGINDDEPEKQQEIIQEEKTDNVSGFLSYYFAILLCARIINEKTNQNELIINRNQK